jgi:hypothetical protein
MDGNPVPWTTRYPVWASIAWAVGASVLIHLVATFLPVGWTPPLVVGFYVVFLVIWTLPASALLGLILGLLLRLTFWRLGSRALSTWRTRLVVSTGYGLLAGAGFFLIFTRLWVAEVNLLAAVAGVCLGFGFVLLISPRPRLTT